MLKPGVADTKYISNQDLAFLLELIRKIVAQFYGQNTLTKRLGTPPTYPIEIILLAAILLKDKLSERVFNIKEDHTIVASAKKFGKDSLLIGCILRS